MGTKGKTFLLITAALAVALVEIYYTTYVLADLWRWFISPAFGLPAITASNAFGLILVFHLFVYGHFRDVMWHIKRAGSGKSITETATPQQLIGHHLGRLCGVGVLHITGQYAHSFS